MDSHIYLNASCRTVKKFIIKHLGFNKENGYSNIKVKKVDNFSFSVEVTLLPYGSTSIFDHYDQLKEYFYFVPYETTFCFGNLDEGFDINESRELDKEWQLFLKEKNQTNFKKIVALFAYS